MGKGNIDVGDNSSVRKTGKPIEQMKAGGSSDTPQMQAKQPNCGAMSQQGGFSYSGNVSSPQQLLRLVGCRDPKIHPERGSPPRASAAPRHPLRAPS